MPATSEKMRRLFCIALSIKLGKMPKGYSPEAARMAKTMSLSDLSDYCRQPIKEKPK